MEVHLHLHLHQMCWHLRVYKSNLLIDAHIEVQLDVSRVDTGEIIIQHLWIISLLLLLLLLSCVNKSSWLKISPSNVHDEQKIRTRRTRERVTGTNRERPSVTKTQLHLNTREFTLCFTLYTMGWCHRVESGPVLLTSITETRFQTCPEELSLFFIGWNSSEVKTSSFQMKIKW